MRLMRQETIDRCRKIETMIDDGMSVMAACRKGRSNWQTYQKYLSLKNTGEIPEEAPSDEGEKPTIEVHNVDTKEPWGSRGFSRKVKQKTGKCIVILTESSDLRSVIEGLL